MSSDIQEENGGEIEALVFTFGLHFGRQNREDTLVRMFELLYLEKNLLIGHIPSQILCIS